MRPPPNGLPTFPMLPRSPRSQAGLVPCAGRPVQKNIEKKHTRSGITGRHLHGHGSASGQDLSRSSIAIRGAGPAFTFARRVGVRMFLLQLFVDLQ